VIWPRPTATTNGPGNLLVGYNEPRKGGTTTQTGSHNIVGGRAQPEGDRREKGMRSATLRPVCLAHTSRGSASDRYLRRGWTQEWGGPVVEIRAGDVVWCPPGVKHWHGATPTTAMTHIALMGTARGKNVDWLEKVSDEQYRKR
jgi:hypothetical protein